MSASARLLSVAMVSVGVVVGFPEDVGLVAIPTAVSYRSEKKVPAAEAAEEGVPESVLVGVPDVVINDGCWRRTRVNDDGCW